jgi:DNA-directed RNA polymerase subunit K/omega
MIHPSISELTSNSNVNRYTLVVATAKCARIITEEYVKQREYAEKLALKDGDKKSVATNLINKDYRDEKAVKLAIKGLHEGDFKVIELDGTEKFLTPAAKEETEEITE